MLDLYRKDHLGQFPSYISTGVIFALTNTFLTGATLHIDGGEPLT